MKLPRIVENSPLARLARLKLGAPNVAMVLGSSIHLSGVSRDQFLRDPFWVAHEMEHIQQFEQYGRLGFLARYLRDWVRYGYYNIPFEVAAREAAELKAHLYAQGRPLPGEAERHPTPKVS
ncbi:hypothetical protein MUN84_13735 [Hymenobacter sp. 5516J-16]|uniref:DUF4157 domain-containing protein n=1 Tax=Hymenobacter sublimis TaxID=2933777 RepID=A0ABY4J9A2_9BACT|nr:MULTISPECIES: hypothetical protein [Hymenobacter]UOQ75713.1 hypothetical protein MUN84_13735 [Hymenobacter sp. 5516J-16]UPL49388.1 hypothetical protein MWH26_00385 [Hymenobacter sublimis]